MRKCISLLLGTCLLLPACVGGADAYAQSPYASQSKLLSGHWWRVPVAQTGVYALTTTDVPALQGAICDRIALFGAPGGMLSPSNMAAHPDDMVPAAIEVVDVNGNGIFEAEDRLLFYGEGASVWRYAGAEQRFVYEMNTYTTENYYFLTPDYTATDTALRVQQRTYTPNGNFEIDAYTAVGTYHEDNLNPMEGGQLWMADRFSSGATTRSYTLRLSQAPRDGAVELRYAMGHKSDYPASFALQSGIERWSHDFNAYSSYGTYRHNLSGVEGTEVSLGIAYTPRESAANGYLDFIEYNYSLPLAYGGGQQWLRNTAQVLEGNRRRFVGQGLKVGLKLWDVTDPSQPFSMPIESGNGGSFAFVAPTERPRTMVAFTAADALSPTGITTLENQDIHGASTPDYVIVCHRDFVEQAEALADLHRTEEGLEVLVYSQDEVFNEYASGRPDPMAIRQMLRHMRKKDPTGTRPRYLLLFGKGTYDNRNLAGSPYATAVTYQYPNSTLSETSAIPSDDVYGYLDDSTTGVFEGRLTVGIGRLPAKNIEEARHLVDKIAGYMGRRDFASSDIRGDWRNYVTLLADDADPSNGSDSVFASDAEKMSRLIQARHPQLNIDKIYADAYTQQSGADGSYYPEVNNALRQRLNYGTLLLNYIGHGSDKYIGTERYMEFSDIEKYTNTDRLIFFVTSTCSFGHYDFADDICGAEAFLLAKAAGIGILTAARPIHHSYYFNTLACLYSLDASNSIGDALRMAKNEVGVSHCIALLGDPALHLSVPQNEVVVTHINSRPVDSARVDSATVLSRVTVEGEIRNRQGELAEGFDGTIYPIVYDREVKTSTLANDNDSTEVAFVQQKNILYKGREMVSGGRFEYSFIVPRDVAYQYGRARLSHYARSSSEDAAGQYSNIMFGGLNEDVAIDELHPTVELYMGDTTFRSGGLTNETPTLYARLRDSVGINAAGSGIGHNITAMVDHNPYSTVTLNDYYEPDLMDGRNGSVYYTLAKLTDGPHTLTVKCWNIFNFSGEATISFVVANDRQGQIGQFAAAPNPAHEGTTLRVEHNMAGTLQSAKIDIYDIRGRHLRQLTPTVGDNGCVVACPWDFTTAEGDRVPQGVYIARVVLQSTTGEVLSQATKVVRK